MYYGLGARSQTYPSVVGTQQKEHLACLGEVTGSFTKGTIFKLSLELMCLLNADSSHIYEMSTMCLAPP